MVGAHTDSPCLRIKPVSKKQNEGYLQVGVETYGGGLWHTWFDRDLSIAGRVMVKEADGSITQKLVKVDKPILRIPTLAIHLDRQQDFVFNKETQLFPITGLVAAELNRQGKTTTEETKAEEKSESETFEPLKTLKERHHPYIVDIIAEHAEVKADSVLDFEMVLYDTQKSCIGGLNDELIYSARLDNQMMTFCAVEGIIESLDDSASLEEDSTIRLIACFDHEEIGSRKCHAIHWDAMSNALRRNGTRCRF